MTANGDAPVFIVGMPRSGTSVTKTLLDAHPDLAIAPETHFIQRWLRLYGSTDVRDRSAFDRFWAHYSSTWHFTGLGHDADEARRRILSEDPLDFRAVFRSLLEQYAQAAGKPRWGEKTPGHFRHLATIFDWFPDARIVFMVRDPRAMAASRIALEVDWSQREIDVLSLGWVDSTKVAARWGTDHAVRVTHYEALVTEPEVELRSLCEFLGVEFSPAMLADRAPEGTTRQYGDLRPKSEVTAERVERWRRVLDPDQVAIIEHICREPMVAQGYGPTTDGLTARQRALYARMTLRRVAGGAMRRGRDRVRSIVKRSASEV